MGFLRTLFIIFILLFSTPSWAVTYYIDYGATDDSGAGTSTATAWKRCPGMVGFSGSYVHHAGDVFVFKGGVTWPAAVLPLTVANSGSAGTPDVYMSGHQCGYTASPVVVCDGTGSAACGHTASVSCNGGVAWGSGYAVFDGEVAKTAAGGPSFGIYNAGKIYLVFDGIHVYRIGPSQSNAIAFIAPSTGLYGIEFKNSRIETYSINGFTLTAYYGGSDIDIHDNYLKDNTNAMYIFGGHSYYSGNTLDDLKIYNNIIEGVNGIWRQESYVTGTDTNTYEAIGAAHVAAAADRPITGASWTTYWKLNASPLGPVGTWTLGTTYGSGQHPDGIQISGNFQWSLSNVKIYNNQLRGYWNSATSMLFMQFINGLDIYGNLIAFENTSTTQVNYSISPGIIALGSTTTPNSNIKIYNNTISSDAMHSLNQGARDCLDFGAAQGTIDIKNNIFSNCEFGIMMTNPQTGTTVTSDYNFFQMRSGGKMIQYSASPSWASTTVGAASTACANGYDCHSLSGDPLFADSTSDGTFGSMDFILQSESPASAKQGTPPGTDLGVSYNTDLLGDTWTTWGMGAYYDVSGGGSPTTHDLVVTKSGTGSGTVTSSPAGVDCGSTCTAAFNEDTVVTLSQVPITGEFTPGWSGDGTGTTTRSVTMSADKAVGAEWTIPDGDAPVLSNGSPSGVLPSGTTSTLLSFNSDENCTCKFKITDDTYANMSATGMTGAGTTTHTLTVTGLTAGSAYNYYFRCVDGTGNTNTSSLNISFSVPTAVVGTGSSFTLGVGGSIQLQ